MLNTKAFILLAGNPETWDRSLQRSVENGAPLTEVQERQHSLGRRSAKLAKSVNGWYVRAASNLQSPEVITPARASQEEAIEDGKAWANEDPANREFFARNEDIIRG